MYIDVFDSSNKWVSRVFPQKAIPSSANKITLKLVIGSRSGHDYKVGFGDYIQTGPTASNPAIIYFDITNYIYSSSYKYTLHTIGDELTAPYDAAPRGFTWSNSAGRYIRWMNYDNCTDTGGSGVDYSSENYDFNHDVFIGWSYGGHNYYADGEINVRPNNTYTLTASWNTSGHDAEDAATITWKNGSSSTDSSYQVGQYSVSVPALPTKSNYTCLGWFGPDGRMVYSGDYVPCSITYAAVYELDAVLNPIDQGQSQIHADADDILVYEDATGQQTDRGYIYGKVNLMVANQKDNKTSLLYLFQGKHTPDSGDTWYDQKVNFTVNAYSVASGGTAIATSSRGYNSYTWPHCNLIENGTYKYAGLRTGTNQPNSNKFGPLTEEYALRANDRNSKFVSKPTGSIGNIEFTMPAPDQNTGISSAYVDFNWEWAKGEHETGAHPWFATYSKSTPSRLKITFDWNVRYYRNYPSDTSAVLFQQVVKNPNTAHTIISSIPTAPSGYAFVEWNTAEDGSGTSYSAGDSISASDNEGNWKLYAIWKRNLKVTYKSNGSGQNDIEDIVDENYTIRPANTFTRIDYIFSGWNTANNGSGDWYEPGSSYTPIADLILFAIWLPEWDYDEPIDILHYVKPDLKIAAKRHSLERPSDVTLVVSPILHPIYDASSAHKDKNFVSDTSKVQYRLENPGHRWETGNDWTGTDIVNETREEYRDSDYDYPTYHTSGTLVTTLYRTDLEVSDDAFDIDEEYHLKARIIDGLGAYGLRSPYTDLALGTGDVTGTKVMGDNNIGNRNKYNCQSDWSQVSLLLKYITKLLVHNPFMDEVLKESRELEIINNKPHWNKKLRNPEIPETDYWQIIEHIQENANDLEELLNDSELSMLEVRSDERSVNGFNRAEIQNYLIPTLIRKLGNKENLVYDTSQYEVLAKILDKINYNHSKIQNKLDIFDERYHEVYVGEGQEGTSPRVLDLDGERHAAGNSLYDRTESDGLENRVRDTRYKEVELRNFENGRTQDIGTSTDHIYDYDISQIDMERSLSDFIYILSRMNPRTDNSTMAEPADVSAKREILEAAENNYDPNNPSSVAALEAATEALNSVLSNYGSYDEEGKWSWKSGTVIGDWNAVSNTWAAEENKLTDYTQYDELVGYHTIHPESADEFANNGCREACMGLCTSGCYQSCVGGCATACGSDCFFGCQTNCSNSCGVGCANGCTGSCFGGCQGSCTGSCKGGCQGTCITTCEGCTADCKRECRGNCGYGCENSCEEQCGRLCGGDCHNICSGGCQNHCTSSCSTSCGTDCSGVCVNGCKGGCSGNCYGGCTTTCREKCYSNCSIGCSAQCRTSCQTTCDSTSKGAVDCDDGCKLDCEFGCEHACSTKCTNNCTNGCSGTCSETCDDGCKNGCKKECSNTCSGSCTSECAQECAGACRGLCSNCSRNCVTACDQGCSSDCTSKCSGSCTNICTLGCSSGCHMDCSLYCKNTCFNSCSQLCGSSCYINCNNGCKEACYWNCAQKCSEACKLTCKSFCTTSCTAGCGEGCNISCERDCGAVCQEGCSKACRGVCYKSCDVHCLSYCTDSCSKVCDQGCNSACGTTCSASCQNSCKNICKDSCTTSCNGSCAGRCYDTCGKQCATDCTADCSNNCWNDCDANCSDKCNRNCGGGCITGCKTTCGVSCSTTCGTGCNSDCQSGCKNQCSTSCWSNCFTNCSKNCTTECGGSCSGTCNDTCEGECTETCEGTCTGDCQGTCTGDCEGTCFDACAVSCGGSCSTTCAQSCVSGCYSGCMNTALHSA